MTAAVLLVSAGGASAAATAPYVHLIGEQRLLQAAAKTAKRMGNHIAIQTYSNAEDSEANDEARQRLAAALGAEHFFDRNDPTRRHQAPDFDLAELPDKPPFQVPTSDGLNFTPLP